MLAVTLLAMLTAAMTAVLRQTLSTWSESTSHETAASGVTIAMQKLCNDIRDGRIATPSSDGRSLTITYPMTIQDSANGEVVYDLSANDPVTRTYTVSNGNLIRRIGTATTILGRGVTNATFAASGGSVTIVLTSTVLIGRKSSRAIDDPSKDPGTVTSTGRVILRNS